MLQHSSPALFPDLAPLPIAILGEQCVANPSGQTRLMLDDTQLGVDVTIVRERRGHPRQEVRDFYARSGFPARHDGFGPAMLYAIGVAWNRHMLATRLLGAHVMFVGDWHQTCAHRYGYWLCRADTRGHTPMIGVVPQCHFHETVEKPSGRTTTHIAATKWLLIMYGQAVPVEFPSDLAATAHAVSILIAQRTLR